jgi:hypothetical protein
VSETQDKPAAQGTTSGGLAPAGGTSGQAPFKPVIPAKAAKRANASVIGMVIALLVSVLAFLPIVLMNPAPKSEGYRPNVDVPAIAANAADVAGFTPATPDTGGAFSPNYARWESGAGSGVPTWEVGYLTPDEDFVGLTQTRKANPTWILQKVANAPATGTRSAGGQDWKLHDSGKGTRSLVLEFRGTTVILSGTAGLDEMSALAKAVVESMERHPAATVSQTGSATP